MLGVPVARLSQSIETLLGSSYVNDFTAYGRNWRVVAQASPEYRRLGRRAWGVEFDADGASGPGEA